MKNPALAVISLAICTGMLFTACGKPAEDNITPEESTSENTVVTEESTTEKMTQTEETQEELTTTENSETEKVTEAEITENNNINEEVKEFIHSTVDANGRFTCEFLGVGANFGSTWFFVSDYDLSVTSLNSGIKGISNEYCKEYLDTEGYLYDMIGSTLAESRNGLYLRYENYKVSGIGVTSFEEYVEYYTRVLAEIAESDSRELEVMNKTVSFAGKDAVCADVIGDEKCWRMIFLEKGDYVAVFYIGWLGEMSNIEMITSLFYPL